MKPISKIAALALLLASLGAWTAYAQNSLFDNPNYRRSLELQRMAKSAYDSGDYLKAVEYSREAEQLSATAKAEAEIQRLKWIANSWKNRAAARIAYGEKLNAETRYPDVWPQAKKSYDLAVSEFDAANYEASTEASKKVVELLADIIPEPKRAALPAYYIVRLIPSERDCFWRIAGYSFVYGDPLKWPELYKANKDKIPDPANPDLILPGIKLTIPSIDGEKREGTWSD